MRRCDGRQSEHDPRSAFSHRVHLDYGADPEPGYRRDVKRASGDDGFLCPFYQKVTARADTMAKTVGDFFIDRLRQWGVRRIYGYPGDGINGVFGALQRAEGKIEFIQARHEEMAAFMAAAHAKFTGELGVCIATSGPGAAHLVNGLYDARLDHMPVLAIAGQQARMALGGHYQQEVDLPATFKDVAGAFVH